MDDAYAISDDDDDVEGDDDASARADAPGAREGDGGAGAVAADVDDARRRLSQPFVPPRRAPTPAPAPPPPPPPKVVEDTPMMDDVRAAVRAPALQSGVVKARARAAAPSTSAPSKRAAKEVDTKAPSATAPAPVRAKTSDDSIVFKVPGKKPTPVATTPAAQIVFRKPAARAPPTMKSTAPPRPPSPVIDDEEDAELQLSPVEDFDIEEEDAMAPVGEIKRSPSPESKEEEEARLNVARALVKLEELKTESEELVLSSTELLLKTIQSTNDYFLLFNPKLFTALRKYKEEARKILDEHGKRSTVANAA